MTNTTTQSITLEIPASAYQKLQGVAHQMDMSLSECIVELALEKAQAIIDSSAQIHLTEREAMRLADLIDNPPPPTQKLLEAQADYERSIANAYHFTR